LTAKQQADVLRRALTSNTTLIDKLDSGLKDQAAESAR